MKVNALNANETYCKERKKKKLTGRGKKKKNYEKNKKSM